MFRIQKHNNKIDIVFSLALSRSLLSNNSFPKDANALCLRDDSWVFVFYFVQTGKIELLCYVSLYIKFTFIGFSCTIGSALRRCRFGNKRSAELVCTNVVFWKGTEKEMVKNITTYALRSKTQPKCQKFWH
jgi:hypothetical protein